MKRFLLSTIALFGIAVPALAQTNYPSPHYHQITVDTTPSAASDAVRKDYVDAAVVSATAKSAGFVTAPTARSAAARGGDRISLGDYGGSPASESTAQGLAVTAYSSAGGGVIYYPSAGSAGWNKSHTNTPSNMTYEMDGPAIHYEQMIGIGDTEVANGKAWAGIPPQGATQTQSLLGCAEFPLGQGTTGTADGDSCISIRVVKQNFATTTIPGSMAGLNIFVKGGGPNTLSNDTYAFNTFTEGGYESGFIQQSENVVEELGSDNVTIAHQTDVQQQVMDDQGGANSYYGYNMTANIGTNIAAIRTVGSGSNRWGNVLQNSYGGIQNLWITDTGSYVLSSDGTSATRVFLGDVGGVFTITNNAGTVLLATDQSGNFSAPTVADTSLVSTPVVGTNSAGKLVAGSGIVETDTFTSGGTWTKSPAATWITATLIGGGSSGAGGPTATAGTAYSGGAGGSGGSVVAISGPASSFSNGSVSVCGAAAGGSTGANGAGGGNATWNGYTAFGAGAPSAGGTVASASGGSGGAQGAGGAASGAAAGSAGSVFGIAGASAASGAQSSTVQIGSSGGGTALSGAGNNGGSSLSAPSGAGSGAGMAATQALLAGGAGGFVFNTARPAGGAAAGASGGAGILLPPGYGTGGGGGANNISGVGGAGGAGGIGAGGGGGGAGSSGGGAGGNGGACFVRIVQQ